MSITSFIPNGKNIIVKQLPVSQSRLLIVCWVGMLILGEVWVIYWFINNVLNNAYCSAFWRIASTIFTASTAGRTSWTRRMLAPFMRAIVFRTVVPLRLSFAVMPKADESYACGWCQRAGEVPLLAVVPSHSTRYNYRLRLLCQSQSLGRG